MSAINTNFNYDFPGELTNEIFFKPLVETLSVSDYAVVYSNVKHKKQLHIAKYNDRLLRAYSGCGVRTDATSPINLENRTLEVYEVEMYTEQCKDTFEDTFFGEFLPNCEEANELGEAIRNYCVESLRPGIQNDMVRLAWAGSLASVSADYNMLDGWFTYFINNPADIAQIDNITVLDQTAGNRTLDYLRNLHEGSATILKQIVAGEKVFLVSGNHYENLMTTYEDSALVGGGLTSRVENGVTVLQFRGIDVLPMWDWEGIFTDAAFPYNGLMNNAIVYTAKENLVLGQSCENQSIGTWYDRNTRLVKFEAQFKFGVNYVHSDLTTWSYGQII